MRRSKMRPGRLVVSLLALSVLALGGCSSGQETSSLAVDKIPDSEIQAMGYLELNEDQPGECFNIGNYLVPGKFNVVFLYSPYDQQSMNIKQQLPLLAQARGDLAIRTVNVNRPDVQGVDWQSPIAQAEGLNSLPYIRIFDPSLNMRAHGRPAREQLLQWLGEMGR
ncbi:MAG: hypothetical protein AB7W16_16310 [Candidatus Obscuribacterales bacterium]